MFNSFADGRVCSIGTVYLYRRRILLYIMYALYYMCSSIIWFGNNTHYNQVS